MNNTTLIPGTDKQMSPMQLMGRQR